MASRMTVAATSVELRVPPSPLGANGLPTSPVASVESPLEANVALFGMGNERTLLLTVDLLFVGAEITRRVRDAAGRCDPSVSVWISASHTHRAPAVDLGKPGLGVASPGTVSAVADQLCVAVEHLLSGAQRARPVRPMLGQTDMSGLSVHRRSRGRVRLTRQGVRWGGIVAAPDFAAPVQRDATRIDWIDDAGNVALVMWHWACHATAYPDPMRVSADYIGVARDCLREKVGPVPVLFLQGFAGDIRPPAIRSLRRDPLRRALIGPGFRRFTATEYNEWSQEIGRRVADVSLADFPSNRRDGVIESERREHSAGQFVKGGQTPTFVQQSLKVGPLRLHGFSAEPSFGHRPRTVNPSTDWYCGYLEDVYGYLPTEKQYHEGGYEVDGFCSPFGCESLELRGIGYFTSIISQSGVPDV